MNQQLNILHKKKKFKSIQRGLVLAIVLLGIYSFFAHNHHKQNYNNESLSLPEQSLDEEPNTEEEQEHEWVTLKTQPGDTLASLFKRAGLKSQDLQLVLNKNTYAKNLSKIKPDQEIQLQIKDHTLESMIFPLSDTQFLVTTHTGKTYTTTIKARKMEQQNDYITATVRGSLYSTAKHLGISYKLIQQMTNIFHWEIDFIHDIRAGDQFTILYEAFYIEDKLISTGDIIAVSYTNKGKKYQAIRHTTANGDYDYYTPLGQSLKKAFTRYPIHFSHISSPYSLSRYHPVLHYRRPHKGVDLAAAIGTPVHATGDGYIDQIERNNSYGNVITIKHSKKYSSLYAHLLKFQKGLSRGDRVKRGQVIGYVGQTGLADGPHCHYELHVHHHPQNPSTVKLPHSLPIPHHELGAFKAHAESLLAQLQLFEAAHLAAEQNKKAPTKG